MALPLVTGGGSLNSVPIALIDLETEQGITGSSYVICYMGAALKPVEQLVNNLGALLKGQSAAPFDLERSLERRFRLPGPQGLAALAASGIDMAAWDALTKASGLPLARMLGGECRPIPTYNSRGLGIIERARGSRSARPDDGVPRSQSAARVPLDAKTDLEVVRAVRKALGPDAILMSEYNQCLSIPEAIRRVRLLEQGEGLDWIEEPTRADDYEGHAAIRRESRTPIQIGENWWGPHEMNKSLAAGASDFVMPDAGRIGGVTGWLRSAALAEADGKPMSSHLYPEVSAHLLAVTPSCHWLEYVDWASPILRTPVKPVDGHVTPQEAPGIGVEWDEEAVARFLVP